MLGLALIIVLGFAPAALLAASRLPIAPREPTWPVPSEGSHAPVRALPVGLPPGEPPTRPADVAATARRALGTAGAEQLLGLLRQSAPRLVPATVRGPFSQPAYPYRFRGLTRLLDRAPDRGVTRAATELGASLTLLAAQPRRVPNAAATAYAVLDRARRQGDCDAQLDLLLLLAAEVLPRDAAVRREGARAASSCPGDPTARWVLAQFESQRGLEGQPNPIGTNSPRDRKQERASLVELVAANPRSGDVLTTLADFDLRAALETHAQPFTVRNQLREVAALYRAALELGTEEARPGLARALVALNEPARAAALLRSGLDAGPDAGTSQGVRLQILLEAEEAAHRFARAEVVARRLVRLGSAAYPRGPRLFPVPGILMFSSPGSAGPLSVGSDTAAPFTIDLQPLQAMVSPVVTVAGFSIPRYRPDDGFVGSEWNCPQWSWRRDAVLAGHAERALSGLERSRPGWRGLACGTPHPARFRALVAAEAGGISPAATKRADRLFDRRQNLWRWAGDLDHAARVTRSWLAKTGARRPLPQLRMAEIDFLRGRFDASAAWFGVAARGWQRRAFDDVRVLEASLGRGVALLAAGRRDEGVGTLRAVAGDAEARFATSRHQRRPLGPSIRDIRVAAMAYFAHALLADDEAEHEELAAAVENYDAARGLMKVAAQDTAWLRPESLFGNQAVAELAHGRVGRARSAIDRALRRDPASPIFLMTSAFIAEREGDRALAIRQNAAALVSDPGAFPAANDLGVQLVRTGDLPAAVTAFRQAVGARPDYALGWFNLGVALSRMGVKHLVSSQGSLARAFELDPELAERQREPTIDAATYRTGLDLAAPLPGRWSFAEKQRTQPVGSLGLLAGLLLAIGLARGVGQASRRDLVEKWLEPMAKRLQRWGLARRLTNPAWSFGVVVLVFGLPLLTHLELGLTAALAFVVGVVVTTGVAVQARLVAARALRQSVHQSSWAPGMAFGLVGLPFGVAWAPLPVTEEATAVRAVHAAAPATLAAIAGILVLESVYLHVPITLSLATATVVMAASTLLPLNPLDGARIRSRPPVSSPETEPAA